MQDIGAVILAAGGSSRLGRPKQFLQHQGRTLIQRAVDAVGDCSPIVVVAGRDYRRIEQEIRGETVCIVEHPEWERGLGSSIRLGVAHALKVAPGLAGLILSVCDQPWVSSALMRNLHAEYQRSRKPIVASSYAQARGVPALFARSHFAHLLALPDAGGGRQIIAQFAEDAGAIDFPGGEVDIDTPDDFLAHLDPENCRR